MLLVALGSQYPDHYPVTLLFAFPFSPTPSVQRSILGLPPVYHPHSPFVDLSIPFFPLSLLICLLVLVIRISFSLLKWSFKMFIFLLRYCRNY